MEKVVKHWHRLPGTVVESPSLGVFKNMGMGHLGTWVSGERGSAGFTAGLDNLGGFLKPKQFHELMISVPRKTTVRSGPVNTFIYSRRARGRAAWQHHSGGTSPGKIPPLPTRSQGKANWEKLRLSQKPLALRDGPSGG